MLQDFFCIEQDFADLLQQDFPLAHFFFFPFPLSAKDKEKQSIAAEVSKISFFMFIIFL
jgi:hypothetical protein